MMWFPFGLAITYFACAAILYFCVFKGCLCHLFYVNEITVFVTLACFCWKFYRFRSLHLILDGNYSFILSLPITGFKIQGWLVNLSRFENCTISIHKADTVLPDMTEMTPMLLVWSRWKRPILLMQILKPMAYTGTDTRNFKPWNWLYICPFQALAWDDLLSQPIFSPVKLHNLILQKCLVFPHKSAQFNSFIYVAAEMLFMIYFIYLW